MKSLENLKFDAFDQPEKNFPIRLENLETRLINFLNEHSPTLINEFDKIEFNLLTMSHIENYLSTVNPNAYKRNKFLIKEYLNFLKENNQIDFEINFKRRKNTRKLVIESELIINFVNYVGKFRNDLETPKYTVKAFLKFINFEKKNMKSNEIKVEDFLVYEQFLLDKMLLKKLETKTLNNRLKCLEIFSEYLYHNENTKYLFKKNKEFKVQKNRSNEYIIENDYVTFVNYLIDNATDFFGLRALTIFLIAFETGCRLSEVSNLNLADVNVKSRTIALKTIKSSNRKLELSLELTSILDKYLTLRNSMYESKIDEPLFILSTGERYNSQQMSHYFVYHIKKCFGNKKFNMRALRNTYITNALDNNFNFDRVKLIVGHKTMKSTMYYYHRNSTKIKKVANNFNFDFNFMKGVKND